jgi:hypothetical protein
LRFPVLFVTGDEVPPPTADALRSMAIQRTYVVGSPASVSDAVMAKLPAPTRLGGPDRDATSMAVANEAKARALPVNVVYVADQTRPIDSAVAAAIAARNGGLLLLSPGAGTAAVERQLDELGLAAHVDRIVVVRSSTSTSIPWPVIVVSVLLAVVGVALLYRAARKRRAQPVPSQASVSPPTLSAQTDTQL